MGIAIAENVSDVDSYVFSAAVNAMAEVAFWRPSPFLIHMAALFADWPSSVRRGEAVL